MRQHGAPDPVFHTPVVLNQISSFRQAIYQHPCLEKLKPVKRTVKSSGDAHWKKPSTTEEQIRDEERRLLKELSRYYWLAGNDGVGKGVEIKMCGELQHC